MPAKTPTAPTALGGTKKSSAQPELNRTTQDLAMPHTARHSRGRSNPELAPGLNRGPPAQASEKLSKMIRTREIPSREILFVDPGVSDIETILGHLRPEVEAIVLDSARPAARQIAAALEDRHDLGSIHVIAHGAPGRISFAAGDWSAATVADEAEDLTAISRALAASGDLKLWSCQTAAGPAGAAFIAGLARASGADIAAATGRVGAAALGGGWELSAAAQPPLTAAGAARYAGILATSELVVTGRLPEGETTKSITYFILDTSRNTIVGQVILPDAARRNISVSVTVKVPTSLGPFAIGAFDEQGNFVPAAFLSVNGPAGGQAPGGAVGR